MFVRIHHHHQNHTKCEHSDVYPICGITRYPASTNMHTSRRPLRTRWAPHLRLTAGRTARDHRRRYARVRTSDVRILFLRVRVDARRPLVLDGCANLLAQFPPRMTRPRERRSASPNVSTARKRCKKASLHIIRSLGGMQ